MSNSSSHLGWGCSWTRLKPSIVKYFQSILVLYLKQYYNENHLPLTLKKTISLYFRMCTLNSCAVFCVEGVLFSGVLRSLGAKTITPTSCFGHVLVLSELLFIDWIIIKGNKNSKKKMFRYTSCPFDKVMLVINLLFDF